MAPIAASWSTRRTEWSNARSLFSPAAVVTLPSSRRADALDLARCELVRFGAVDEREDGEFQRRRAGVESQDFGPKCVTPPPWRPYRDRRRRGRRGASIRTAGPARMKRARSRVWRSRSNSSDRNGAFIRVRARAPIQKAQPSISKLSSARPARVVARNDTRVNSIRPARGRANPDCAYARSAPTGPT